MTSFDEQLSLSSPAVPVRTPDLDAELAHVVAQAERHAGNGRSRRRYRVVVGGLVLVGALGGAGAAAATGRLPWFDSAPAQGQLTTSDGSRCDLTFGIKQVEDRSAPVAADVRAEVTAAATAFLEALDVSTLSTDQGGGAEDETGRVFQQVAERLDAALARQDLPSSSVALSMASSCARGDR